MGAREPTWTLSRYSTFSSSSSRQKMFLSTPQSERVLLFRIVSRHSRDINMHDGKKPWHSAHNVLNWAANRCCCSLVHYPTLIIHRSWVKVLHGVSLSFQYSFTKNLLRLCCLRNNARMQTFKYRCAQLVLSPTFAGGVSFPSYILTPPRTFDVHQPSNHRTQPVLLPTRIRTLDLDASGIFPAPGDQVKPMWCC